MSRTPGSAPANWDLEVDVVAAGSGLASLTAAIVAADAGKSAVVLEKAPKLGGLSAYGGGEVFVANNHKMESIGVTDSDEAGRAYLEFLSAGYADPALFDTLLANCKTAVEYLEEKAGVKWLAVAGLPDYYYPDAPGTHAGGRYLSVEIFDGAELGEWQSKTYLTPHMPLGILHSEMYEWGGLANVTGWNYELVGQRITEDKRTFGNGMMAYLVKAAMLDRGIPAHVGTPVRELIVEGVRVIGVRAEKPDGSDFFVRARSGVLLAVGGYDHNKAMACQFENMPDWNSAAQPFLHGDAITMACEIGAALGAVPPTNLAMFYGYNIPGEEADGAPVYRSSWECGCPHAIWVNKAGRRFCNEAFYKDYQPRLRYWDGNTQSQPNLPPYLILSQDYRDRYPLGSFMPGMEIPEQLAAKADTPRELAAKLGIDPDGLEATIARFNEFAAKGEDPDFGRGAQPWSQRLVGDMSYPNPNLGPLERGPFYGVKLVPVSVGINSHGLKTDTSAQVVHVRGHAIPGLYAAGNSAALLDLGGGYQSGTSNMRAITWGFLAGRHMSGTA